MIHHITGAIVKINPTSMVLETGGVGFFVHIPATAYERFPKEGRVTVHTYLDVGESHLRLFGFADEHQRRMFELLLSINGIGPQLGLTILSGVKPEELRQIILDRKPELLTRVKGIGRKTADRVVLELRDKISSLPAEALQSGTELSTALQLREDATLALLGMGFTRPAAEKAVAHSLRENPAPSLEALIKSSLRLARQ